MMICCLSIRKLPSTAGRHWRIIQCQAWLFLVYVDYYWLKRYIPLIGGGTRTAFYVCLECPYSTAFWARWNGFTSSVAYNMSFNMSNKMSSRHCLFLDILELVLRYYIPYLLKMSHALQRALPFVRAFQIRSWRLNLSGKFSFSPCCHQHDPWIIWDCTLTCHKKMN